MTEDFDFELRLINVNWSSKNQFAYITEISKNPIPITKQDSNHFTADIPSYPQLRNKIPCQFAILCKANISFEIPRVKRQEDTKDLFPITDSKYGKWWIEKGTWIKRKEYKYHDAPSCRHAGEFTILVGDNVVHLNIIPSGFSLAEYQELLASFKGDLWQLILDKDSTTTILKDGTGNLPGDEFQKQVKKFIKYADQVLAKPSEELKEKQEVQRIEKVRPTSKTFMELATKGNSVKFVTGRGYKPTYNTPENKYIADIIWRLVLIVKNLRSGVSYSKNSLYRSADFLQKQIFQNQSDFLEIDPAKLEAEIKQEERKKQKAYQQRSTFIDYFSNIDVGNQQLEFKEQISFTVRKCEFKEEYPAYIDIWLKVRGQKGALLKVPSDSCATSLFSKNIKYTMSDVSYTKNDYQNFSCGIIEKVSDLTVETDPHEKVIISLKKEYDHYSNNHWRRPLNNQEKKEKELEQASIRKRQETLAKVTGKYEEKLVDLISIYKELIMLSKKCKFLGIKGENRLEYPGTMTFVQNPSYRGAYTSYKEIKNELKLENLFDDLITIQEFGITDQPNIYEKWCLLQIIFTIENYGFTQDDGWEAKLVSLISGKNYATCSFSFSHHSLDQRIVLIYQPKIENRKTPDFMLIIKSKTDETKLVLDAKNKDYAQLPAQFNTFSDDLDNLVNKKGYSEAGKNAVFILHPKKKEGFLPVSPTPQTWSNCTTLGGSSVFKWEEDGLSPEHMYGGVQVRPENLDNLKILIALSLQYLTEDNHKVYNEHPPQNCRFCIVCGGVELNDSQRCETKGKHYTCKECHHFFVEHYCGCGTRLWKHGSYWTYHDTRSTEPYNIKCPNCNGIYIPDPENERMF